MRAQCSTDLGHGQTGGGLRATIQVILGSVDPGPRHWDTKSRVFYEVVWTDVCTQTRGPRSEVLAQAVTAPQLLSRALGHGPRRPYRGLHRRRQL